MYTKINNCFICNCEATIKSDSVWSDEKEKVIGRYWVESECGTRGKLFAAKDISSIEAVENALEFWNKHNPVVSIGVSLNIGGL